MSGAVLSESQSRFDVYRAITDKIILAMEAGIDPFEMPWHGPGGRINRPKNAATDAFYRGVNIVALWAEATLKDYGSSVCRLSANAGSVGAALIIPGARRRMG